jgi:transposase InsO family protein
MPWKEHRALDLREEFVLKAKAPGANVSALCREYGISRKTGHKWLARFEKGGPQALKELSRRPHRALNATDGEVVLQILEARHAHPRWGPKKLRAILSRKGVRKLPTVRTVARILLRAGEPLVRPRRSRSPTVAVMQPLPSPPQSPNALWTVDFKGWWRTRDGKRCEPLTVRDAFSRFVLCARLLESTRRRPVQQAFERLFEQYGLPDAIQVDNGPPFSSPRARFGLTALSAWWISIGVRVVRSRPGCPQDNGGHERMHEDIALDLELSPADNISTQQHALDAWVEEFNQVRPHEALGMKVPADVYRRSSRRYRGPIRPCYPQSSRLRRVSPIGRVRLDGQSIFIGCGVAGHDVAVQHIDDATVRILFYHLELARFSSVAGSWTFLDDPTDPTRNPHPQPSLSPTVVSDL